MQHLRMFQVICANLSVYQAIARTLVDRERLLHLPMSQFTGVNPSLCKRKYTLTCSIIQGLPFHVADRNPPQTTRSSDVPWSRSCDNRCWFPSYQTRVQPTKVPRGRHAPRRPWKDQGRHPGSLPFESRDFFQSKEKCCRVDLGLVSESTLGSWVRNDFPAQ